MDSDPGPALKELNVTTSQSSVDDPLRGMLDRLADQVEGLKGDDLHAYEDLEFYSRHVIGYGNPDRSPNSKFIKRIYEDLQYTNDDMLILGPRNSAKSESVTITYTTWKIGRNPLIRFLLSFASITTQGEAFGRQFDTIFEENERYIKIFGRLKPPIPIKWSATEKIVQRPEPPSGMKDPTIAITGVGASVPSKRCDEVICDDLVTQINAYSETQRQHTKTFVLQALFPIVDPGGRKIILGSRWDPRDLYGTMIERWRLTMPDLPPINLDELIIAMAE